MNDERKEAAIARRLDQIDRRLQRVERDLGISIETLALFVRFWLTSTPALPDAVQPEARTEGRQRYDAFVDSLGRRLSKGPKLSQEIGEDIAAAAPPDTAESHSRKGDAVGQLVCTAFCKFLHVALLPAVFLVATLTFLLLLIIPVDRATNRP